MKTVVSDFIDEETIAEYSNLAQVSKSKDIAACRKKITRVHGMPPLPQDACLGRKILQIYKRM